MSTNILFYFFSHCPAPCPAIGHVLFLFFAFVARDNAAGRGVSFLLPFVTWQSGTLPFNYLFIYLFILLGHPFFLFISLSLPAIMDPSTRFLSLPTAFLAPYITMPAKKSMRGKPRILMRTMQAASLAETKVALEGVLRDDSNKRYEVESARPLLEREAQQGSESEDDSIASCDKNRA